MTTSSPNLTYTNQYAKAGDQSIDDQYIIEQFGLDPNLRGEDLDNAARAAVKKLNEQDAARDSI